MHTRTAIESSTELGTSSPSRQDFSTWRSPGNGFRELGVNEIKEVLRGWLGSGAYASSQTGVPGGHVGTIGMSNSRDTQIKWVAP